MAPWIINGFIDIYPVSGLHHTSSLECRIAKTTSKIVQNFSLYDPIIGWMPFRLNASMSRSNKGSQQYIHVKYGRNNHQTIITRYYYTGKFLPWRNHPLFKRKPLLINHFRFILNIHIQTGIRNQLKIRCSPVSAPLHRSSRCNTALLHVRYNHWWNQDKLWITTIKLVIIRGIHEMSDKKTIDSWQGRPIMIMKP